MNQTNPKHYTDFTISVLDIEEDEQVAYLQAKNRYNNRLTVKARCSIGDFIRGVIRELRDIQRREEIYEKKFIVS